MAFWGVELKPGKPFSLKSACADATQISRRLHVSQATLGLGSSTLRTTVQCNVGSRSPLFLCALSPDKVYSCPLSIEFAESDTVVFSVIGPGPVHLTGYFLPKTSSSYRLNDDESESYGEDIAESDAEKASSDDYDYSDSFINDDEPSVRASHLSTSDSDDQISIKEMAAKTKDKINNGKGRRLRKKYLVCDSGSGENSFRDDNLSSGDSLQLLEKTHSEESRQSLGEGNKVLSVENPLPSPTHTNTPEKMEDEPVAEVEESCETPSKEKRKEGSVVVDREGKTMLESLQNEKQASDKEDEPVAEVEESCETPSKEKIKEGSVVADREGKTMLESVQNEKPATDSEDKPLGDVEKSCETPSKKKGKGSSVVVNSDDRTMPESVQNEKPAADEEDKSLGEVEKSCETPSKKKRKERSDDRTRPETLQNVIPSSDMGIKTTSDVLPPQNGDAAVAKKKRNRDGREEDKEGKKNPSKPEKKKKKKKKKEAIKKTTTTEEAGSGKPMEPEFPSNEVTIEETAKGNLGGKSAVRGRKVSVLYTGMLKETQELFDIRFRDVPLRHRLGGAQLIEGLTIGIQGMRVGDKRRLIIPPSLGYAEEGLGDSVPKNAWLVYEVEAVKVR